MRWTGSDCEDDLYLEITGQQQIATPHRYEGGGDQAQKCSPIVFRES